MKKTKRYNAQLRAHCLFAFGEVRYDNYSKYYKDLDVKTASKPVERLWV